MSPVAMLNLTRWTLKSSLQTGPLSHFSNFSGKRGTPAFRQVPGLRVVAELLQLHRGHFPADGGENVASRIEGISHGAMQQKLQTLSTQTNLAVENFHEFHHSRNLQAMNAKIRRAAPMVQENMSFDAKSYLASIACRLISEVVVVELVSFFHSKNCYSAEIYRPRTEVPAAHRCRRSRRWYADGVRHLQGGQGRVVSLEVRTIQSRQFILVRGRVIIVRVHAG
jgi:hypothetical protein